MDTITNAAQKVFGGSNTESGREPVSGETGNTGSGEPYDAGNSDSTNTESTKVDDSSTVGESKTTADTPDSGIPSSGTQQSGGPGNAPNTGPIRPEHETDKTGVTSAHQPASGFASDRPTNANDSSGPGPEPSVGADPASAPQNTQKHQGADRPHEEPGEDENRAIKDTKKEAEEAANADTSGPGPKPLSEAQGGNASGSGGDDDGPQKESHGSGTGEKYVKSSGMKADGGDFDAAAAGAGREADRLLEEKGIHHEPDAVGPPKGQDETQDEKDDKPGLKSKIKAKLGK